MRAKPQVTRGRVVGEKSYREENGTFGTFAPAHSPRGLKQIQRGKAEVGLRHVAPRVGPRDGIGSHGALGKALQNMTLR